MKAAGNKTCQHKYITAQRFLVKGELSLFFLRQDESTISEQFFGFFVNQLKFKTFIDIQISKKPPSKRANHQKLAPDLGCV